MLKNNPVLFFLIKLILIFALLAAPVSAFDSMYGNFYRSVSKYFFNTFHDTGVAVFSKTKVKFITHIDVGNRAYKHDNGAIDTATADFNTRYRGYIPTILLLSLILASPISPKRKIFSSLIGLFIMTSAVMFKQWIHIQYMCTQAKWLKLYNFSEEEERRIGFLFNNIANYSGPSLILAVAIWILVSFRKQDIDFLLK